MIDTDIECDIDKSIEHDHKNIEHGLDTDTEPDNITFEKMTKIRTLNGI